MLPQKPLLAGIFQQIARLGAIHPVFQPPTSQIGEGIDMTRCKH
jgi:hypothetical protein